jgi:glyoxylase-like metal-dependent hydrolase (beta-lactamase superfamily II)
MKKISDRVYYKEGYLETDRPILGLIVGQNKTIMVDAGNSPHHAMDFKRDIKDFSLPYPDFVVITHAHCDHIFGIQEMDRPTIANQLIKQRVKELKQLDWNEPAVSERIEQGIEHPITKYMLDIEYPGRREDFIRLPDIVYEKRLELDLGAIHCLLETIGGDHSPDSTIIHIPEEQIMFLGDCLYLKNITEKNIHDLFQKLLSYDVKVYIDSHENDVVTKNELERKYQAYLQEVSIG